MTLTRAVIESVPRRIDNRVGGTDLASLNTIYSNRSAHSYDVISVLDTAGDALVRAATSPEASIRLPHCSRLRFRSLSSAVWQCVCQRLRVRDRPHRRARRSAY